jgi:hypothetical protein
MLLKYQLVKQSNFQIILLQHKSLHCKLKKLLVKTSILKEETHKVTAMSLSILHHYVVEMLLTSEQLVVLQ